MKNKKVNRLYYRIRSAKGVHFSRAEPLDESNEDFNIRIDNKRLIIDLKKEFYDVEEAKGFLFEFLRSWEIKASLEGNPNEIRFQFQKADIETSNNNDEKITGLIAQNLAAVTTTAHGTVEVFRNKYPLPPKTSFRTNNVEWLFQRYMMYKEGKEQITTTANVIYTYLTMLTDPRKGRKHEDAADKFKIDQAILNKLGEILATRGSILEARKVTNFSDLESLSQKEKEWLEKISIKIIKRIGQLEKGYELYEIKMEDLPQLN